MAKAKGTRTYILTLFDGGQRKITIPAHWKLTFGNIIPYHNVKQSGSYPSNMENRIALRIYEGSKENLRGVMTDVRSFVDGTIQIMEKRGTKKTTTKLKKNANGIADVEVAVNAVPTWKSPDQIEAEESVPWPLQQNN